MMRLSALMPIPLVFALLAAPVAAQGCISDSPCPLELTVDEDGFSDQREWNVTVGDVYRVTLSNLDLDATHTVTLEGYGVALTAGPLEDAEAMVTFDQVGDFFFTDEPSADEAVVHVLDVDAVAFEDGSDDAPGGDGATATTSTGTADAGDADTPAAPMAALVGLLAALAVAVRRRK